MGIVGEFIDECCERHPQLMQAVLERPLSPLEKFLAWDENGQPCGCLIGTVALAAGARPLPRTTSMSGRCNLPHNEAYEYAAAALGMDDERTIDVGIKVADISRRLYAPDCYRHTPAFTTATDEESDARAVHLLRQRIARSLVIRQSKDSAPVQAAERFLASCPA